MILSIGGILLVFLMSCAAWGEEEYSSENEPGTVAACLASYSEGAFLHSYKEGFRIYSVGMSLIENLEDGEGIIRAERHAQMQAKRRLSEYVSQKIGAEKSLQSGSRQSKTAASSEIPEKTEKIKKFFSEINTETESYLEHVETLKIIHHRQNSHLYAKVLICFASKNTAENEPGKTGGKMKSSAAPVLPKYEWIECTGRGISRNQALENALVEGVRQVYGTYMENEEKYRYRFTSLKKNAASEKNSQVVSDSELLTQTRGFVNAYRILSVQKDENSIYSVTINAEFVNPRRGGIRAVMLYPMDMSVERRTRNYSVAPGMRMSGSSLANLCAREFEKAFTEKNRFLVLNRKDMKQALREHKKAEELADAGEASPAELAKLGKMLTADYIVRPFFENFIYSRKLQFNSKQGKFVPVERIVFHFGYTMFEVSTASQVKNSSIEAVLDNRKIQAVRAEDRERTEEELARVLFRRALDCAVERLAEDAEF